MNKAKAREKIISLIEEARELCCKHDIDWLECCEESRI
jgi:hypothetical protein